MMRTDALMDMVNSMTDDVALVTQVPYSNDRLGFAGTLEQAFGGVLAEDYFIGVALMKRGWKSAISTHPALQNSADPSVSKFHARIRRWMKLRIAMLPHMMLVEPLQDCFISGLLGSLSAWYLFGINFILYSIIHCFAWFLCDYALIRTLQNGPLSYSIIDFGKGWVVREGLAPVIYIRALINPNIEWRNGRFRLHWGGQIKAS
uniref:Ceramide glucosyltransferase n=1 Tax=Heterorhabditis bacteriophora TaxID=37862 RepID=A0A1I7WRR0_HETBA